MSLRPRGRAIVPAAAAALLLAACGTSADPAPPERPRTTAQPVRLPEPLLERPVDTARLSPLELAAVGRAELIERAACMRRYGFDDRVRFTRSLYATLPDRSYGVMTEEEARRHGYHMAPDVDPRVPANQKKQTDLVTSRPPRTAADRRVRALVLYGTASDTLTEADARRADGPSRCARPRSSAPTRTARSARAAAPRRPAPGSSETAAANATRSPCASTSTASHRPRRTRRCAGPSRPGRPAWPARATRTTPRWTPAPTSRPPAGPPPTPARRPSPAPTWPASTPPA
ncbi:hypothetical protein O1M54_26920 [Streptomyces diastatochromogenes]|nr:hypothetical protein [Streptomyces diastatochromogenes]